MSRKKILIIARDFIPYYNTLGGVIRVIKFAEYLHKKNIDVTILASKGYFVNNFGYEETIKQLRIIYVEDTYQKYNTKSQVKRANTKTSETKTSFIKKLSKIIRTKILELSIPDIGIFFGGNLFHRACTLIEEDNITNVFVTSPPHSTQIIGLRIKKHFGNKINLLAEYRDSWNTVKIFRKKNFIANFISKKLEHSVLKNCDHFIYSSPNIIKKITEQIIDVSDKSLLVTNGFDNKIKQKTSSMKSKNAILTIGYFGSITDADNSFRDPTHFLEALSKFDSPIKLVFFGSTTINRKWERIFREYIELKENLPHSQALEEMSKMDLLLLLHSEEDGADEVITGKLFEYVLVERPILSVGPLSLWASHMVQEKSIGYTMDINSQSNMQNVLKKIHSDWSKNLLPEVLRSKHPEFNRAYQYAKILPLLK